MTDISPPQSLSVALEVKGLGVIQLTQRVTFSLESVNAGKTEISCQATGERLGSLLRLLLRGRVRRFGERVLEGVEERLKRLA